MKKNSILFSAIILSLTILCFTGCKENTPPPKDIMLVHFFDVGQGDSILIQVNNKNLLIDAGPKEATEDLIKELNDLNIKKLEYIVATHPHEDHIGSMAQVIKDFNIDKFYAPKAITKTKIFESMINELKNKNLKINPIKVDTESDIDLGDNTKVEIFSPNSSEYDNLNNYSPIIKVSYNDTSFLFTGDAEKLSEKEVLAKKYNIKADVLKLGHHGSNTSTSKDFFNSVNPSIGIISVAKKNDYGHPSKETIKLLKENELKYYMTSDEGTIILESNGKNIIKK